MPSGHACAVGISARGRLIEIRRATLVWTATTWILVLAWARVLVAGRSRAGCDPGHDLAARVRMVAWA